MNEPSDSPLPRTRSDPFAKILADDETLVEDSRSCLTPSQQVEQKLVGILIKTPLMISQMQRCRKPGPR